MGGKNGFGFFDLWHINLSMLFNTTSILAVIFKPFSEGYSGISLKVNINALLVFEIVYYQIAIKHMCPTLSGRLLV